MASPSPTFVAVEATVSDLPAFLDISNAAFENSPFMRATYPPERAHLTTPEDLRAWQLRRMGQTHQNDQAVAFKVIAHDSAPELRTVVAYSVWYSPEYDWNKTSHRKQHAPIVDTSVPASDSDRDHTEDDDPRPACQDPESSKLQQAALDKMRKDVWGEPPQKFWYLAALAVHPNYQRRGIASMLLKWGLDAADRDGLPLYLEASQSGKPVYSRHGFIEVASATFFDDTYTISAMQRMPAVQPDPHGSSMSC